MRNTLNPFKGDLGTERNEQDVCSEALLGHHHEESLSGNH